MSYLHLVSGFVASPYVVGKFLYNYAYTWFLPSITLIKQSEEIELNDIQASGGLNDIQASGGLNNIQASGSLQHNKIQKKYTVIPYTPIGIKFPSPYDITSKILTTVIIEVPIFVAKSFYTSPITTTIALYAVLPEGVWLIVGPKLIYHIPKLL